MGRIAYPDEFLCPITWCKMVDPVVASDGHSYERSAIQDVFDRGGEGGALSPLTREVLIPPCHPNIALRKRIQQHGEEELRVAEAAASKAREVALAEGLESEVIVAL